MSSLLVNSKQVLQLVVKGKERATERLCSRFNLETMEGRMYLPIRSSYRLYKLGFVSII
jgi:hypothetical protein